MARRPPLRVFLTGASSGIGDALARHYAARGATLGLVARRPDVLARLCASLPAVAVPYALDVRDARALSAAAQDFMASHGCPDLVIANAGVSHGTLTEYAEDIDAFQDIVDINLMGTVKTFQPFVAPMRAAGGGTLAGISSVAAVRGLPGAGAYSASKAAMVSYLESLRVELRAAGVRVVTIQPGYVRTPMTDLNPYPMPFILTPERAALRIAAAIEGGRSQVVLPWQMALVAALLRHMPNWLYDRASGRAPHKPRRGSVKESG